MVTKAACHSLPLPILALFPRLGQSSTLIRHKTQALGKRARQAGGL